MTFSPVSSVQFSAASATRSSDQLSGSLSRFREGLFRHLDRAAGFDEPTSIRTMTPRYGIASLSATREKLTVTLAEKADADKKDRVRRVVSETIGGSYYGKPVVVEERPCRHLELGAHQSWSGIK